MKNNLKILFMGTPDFALSSLDSICNSKHNLCCVVTSPDRKSGRGQKTKNSPVKDYCLDNNINLIQPESFEDEEFLNRIKKLSIIEETELIAEELRLASKHISNITSPIDNEEVLDKIFSSFCIGK